MAIKKTKILGAALELPIEILPRFGPVGIGWHY
jgi:hypothetical protein